MYVTLSPSSPLRPTTLPQKKPILWAWGGRKDDAGPAERGRISTAALPWPRFSRGYTFTAWLKLEAGASTSPSAKAFTLFKQPEAVAALGDASRSGRRTLTVMVGPAAAPGGGAEAKGGGTFAFGLGRASEAQTMIPGGCVDVEKRSSL